MARIVAIRLRDRGTHVEVQTFRARDKNRAVIRAEKVDMGDKAAVREVVAQSEADLQADRVR